MCVVELKNRENILFYFISASKPFWCAFFVGSGGGGQCATASAAAIAACFSMAISMLREVCWCRCEVLGKFLK